ncbi:MAG: Fis family transcriptional regulator [Mycolicibacterium rufum]|uniref:Alginate biosynthesis transcriptional regulatory protein AlgB n=1 Tax=Mycolicibacterium chlorophenolicum TaxID=37916 RepID=A0A0J6Y6T6_9MYCO|nr:helix-turn-helix domain-containing protein [Mycolicibacterium chlorophenolicum]KMO68751.1 Alginate biosynthesis transcriptional regulatory protein AlgB [Mycolicibacterium chlorophenolicum]MBI5337971.1 Fis family transcriptional regulator [Mycolicibacterium rufum]
MPDGLPDRIGAHGLEPTAVPDRLLASWQRSEDYGIPLDGVEPVFTGTENLGSLFFECGNEVLADLHRTLADEPISLMLTDADGVVLSRLSGDHSLLKALDDVHLAPGFAYSERDVGTNGLGLALADRAPTLVRADQHYALSLNLFTCAAVPVLDPRSGLLEGSVNLTTWSHSSSDLLLALARSAASNTTALMLARNAGRSARPTPRGQVFRVEVPRLEPGSGTLGALSSQWTDAVAYAADAMAAGSIVAAIGEPGAGRATALGQAARRAHPRDRILSAGAPEPDDVPTWLSLWTPELGKSHTAVIVRDVDLLPVWAAERLRDLITRGATTGAAVPFAVTAERFADIPAALARLVDTVVEVPPLRDRPSDVLPLAAHIARRARGRDVGFTPAAARALHGFGWPGNADQLSSVVRHAVSRTDLVDVGHLPSEVLAGNTRRLSRIEAFERGEIIRVLAFGTPTMADAARELGMSRATLYRKIAQYDIDVARLHG